MPQTIQTILNNPYYFIPFLIWCLVWKGMALWKAGRNNQPVWFVALLVINTVGLLEITYLLFFQKRKK